MRALRPHLKYVFLAGNSQKPVIINSNLSQQEEKRLVKILQENIGTIGFEDIKLQFITLASNSEFSIININHYFGNLHQRFAEN